MRQLYYVSSVVLLVLLALWHNAVAMESGLGECFGLPDEDMLQDMIEKYSSIELEFLAYHRYVCRSVSGQGATVGVNFSCTGGQFCNGNDVGVLYDLECADHSWFITDMEIVTEHITDSSYDNCSYCLTNETRAEMFPSRPTNSYQYIEKKHCLFLPHCYTDENCRHGTEIDSEKGLTIETAADCCVGSDFGMAYKIKNDECFPCKVHGFSEAFPNVTEGDNVTIEFTKLVKGFSRFPSPDLSGIISSEATDDYNGVFFDFSTDRNGGDVIVTTIDDVLAFEDDTIVLRHETTTGIKEGLEQFGEFVRDFTTVTIIDNEESSFSFENDAYTVREGQEQSATIVIGQMHDAFNITVTAKFNDISLGDDTFRADEQDLFDPKTYEVEASNQMFDIPLTDFVFDDYIVEYTQKFLLEACYKDICNTTFVFIEDNDMATITSELDYEFSEFDDEMLICVNITGGDEMCPVEFDVSIILNITRTSDYIPNSLDSDMENHTIKTACAFVNFTQCEDRVCVDLKEEFELSDDEKITLDQTFNYSLLVNTLLPTDSRDSIFVDEAIGNISVKDNDQAILRLEYLEYVVTEPQGSVRVCVILQNSHPGIDRNDEGACYIGYSLYLLFITKADTATSTVDYKDIGEKKGTGTVIFPKCSNKTCVNIMIKPDDEIEAEEIFTVSVKSKLSNNNNSVVINESYSTATIRILPHITIGLEKPSFSATENSLAEVCVTLIDIPSSYEDGYKFNVSITTDEPGAELAIFEITEDSNLCQEIKIGDDYTVNNTLREIMVTLASLTPSVAGVDSSLANGNITVLDNDEVDVTLEYPTYTFNETEGEISVCAVVVGNKTSCPIDEPEFISISTKSSTAESPEDYAAKSLMAPIPRCQRILCSDIIVEHDGVVEEVEVFRVTLEMSPGLDPRVHLNNFFHSANVRLIDNDSANVSLDFDEYVISEDSTTLEICIETLTGNTKCSVQYDFNVSIITPFSVDTILIPECENKTCVEITLDSLQDNVVTGNRTFTINLMESEKLEDKRIKINTSSSILTVKENDSGTVALSLKDKVLVEGGSTEICLDFLHPSVNCSAFNISFEAYFKYGVNSDGTPTNDSTIVYDHSECIPGAEFCTIVTIPMDNSVGMKDFSASIESTNVTLVTVEVETIKIPVRDTNSVTVEFVKDVYSVSEKNGTVIVCVSLVSSARCPVAFDFDVLLSTIDDSAIAGEDYMATSMPFTYSRCESGRRCLTISVFNDTTLEELEIFKVVISSTVNNTSIILGTEAAVNIIDGSSRTVGFDMVVYDTDEDKVSQSVCVVVTGQDTECPYEEAFDLQIITSDDTALAETDYEAVEQTLQFSECERMKCIDITIYGDEKVRPSRSFNVKLDLITETITNEILLVPDLAKVVIADNSLVTVAFEKIKFPVNETTVGGVELVIEAHSKYEINCTLFPFGVILKTIDGTAKSGFDYEGISGLDLSFDDCKATICDGNDNCVLEVSHCITIFEDHRLEGQETFTASLEKPNGAPSFMKMTKTEAVVEIHDMDGDVTIEVSTEEDVIYESAGNIMICATIDAGVEFDETCPIEPSFNLTATTVEGKAKSDDFTSKNVILEFGECETQKKCFSVEIKADNVLEDNIVETFEIHFDKSESLKKFSSLSENIIIDPEILTLDINDDTPGHVIITLKEKIYLINDEESISLNVCGVMNYPIDFDFSVDFVLKDSSDDVVDTFTAQSGSHPNQICAEVVIETDVEKGTLEKYTISMSRTEDLDERILLDPEPARVFITDVTESAVQCFYTVDCTVGTNFTVSATAEQCCVGEDNSLAYMEDGVCGECIVHGFTQMNYEVTEGLTISVEFKPNVKGESKYENVILPMLGTITSEPEEGTSECDYECTGEIETGLYGTAEIPFKSINDDITLEYDDKVKMVFAPLYEEYRQELMENGEFIRAYSYVHIIDNDDLQINFNQMKYAVNENGEIESNIKFQYRKTQGEFNLNLHSVSIDEFMMRMREGGMGGMHGMGDMEGMGGMGGMEGSGDDDFMRPFMRDNFRFPDFCNATKDVDFYDNSETLTVSSSENDPTTSTYELTTNPFLIEDDDINENSQVFILVAHIETEKELKETRVCFLRHDKDCGPCRRFGIAIIVIIDNDPMVIGFNERGNIVAEPGQNTIFKISINSTILSERDHLVQVDVVKPKSSATVDVKDDSTTDALFGSIQEDGSIGENFTLLKGEESYILETTVLSDTRGEMLECFILRISAPDSVKHRDVFSCNKDEGNSHFCYFEFCIEELDVEPCNVRFVEDKYTAYENDGIVFVCVNMTCAENNTNTVELEVYAYDSGLSGLLATPSPPSIDCIYSYENGDDYEEQIIGCNKLRGIVINENEYLCFNQSLNDDETLEKTEFTGLHLDIKDMEATTMIDRPKTVIEIHDNDPVTVGLSQRNYYVDEDEDSGKVRVCAEVMEPKIDCPVSFPFYVKIQTHHDTAGSNDFTSVDTELYFDACDNQSCIDIVIKDDCSVERLTERFSVVLDRGFGMVESIRLEPATGYVIIIDTDTAVVEFPQDVYYATEGVHDTVYVCPVVRGCNIEFEFGVAVSTESRTATFRLDFEPVNEVVEFVSKDRAECVEVEIIDDDTVEPDEEYLIIKLERSANLDSRITLENTRADIIIKDIDRTRFGLTETYCMVYENATDIEICVGLKPPYETVACPVDFDFDLQFTIDTDTVSSGDIGGDDKITKTIGRCGREQCITVPIVNDNVLERQERFFVTLEPLPGHEERIELFDTVKVVVIIDDDKIEIDITGKNTVVEGQDRNLTVCLTIMKPTVICPTHESFNMVVYTSDDTAVAGLDFVDMSRLFEFEPCNKQVCHNIAIIDDSEVENDEEFTINVMRPNGVNKKIKLMNSEKTITIVDTDRFTLEFEQDQPRVVEEGEIIEVCVVIPVDSNCPYRDSFSIDIITSDITATSRADYVPPEPELTFESCDKKSCVNINIVDDCILESLEMFKVRMMRTVDLHPRIHLSGDEVKINITDNDELTVKLATLHQIHDEDKGPAQVCAVLDNGCFPSESFEIHMRTLVDSAEPGADYIPVENGILTFTSEDNNPCIPVIIIDERIVEQNESFAVTLERTPGLNDRIIIDPFKSEGEVVIGNDDEAILCFQESEVEVDEEEDAFVTICVVVVEPDIDNPIAYPVDLDITFTSGTAVAGEDFEELKHAFRFESREDVNNCFDIEIIDDKILETTETFSVQLGLADGASKDILLGENCRDVEVSINDMDVLMIGFSQTVYEADENQDSVMVVCAEVEEANEDCLADFAFKVGFRTDGGSAEENDDYIPVTNAYFTFELCDTIDCIIVELINDCIIEDTEEINLRLSELPGQDPRVKIGGGDSVIEIIDNDYITVGMEDTSYSVVESEGRIEVCVVVEQNGCSSSDVIVVALNTRNDSADLNDYVSLYNQRLVFAPYEDNKCTQIRINNDLMLEQTESFTVTLSINNDPSGRVLLGQSEARITIINDDVAVIALELEECDVSEEVGEVIVCVVIVEPQIPCPIVFPFDLVLQTTPITAEANVDYIPPLNDLRFDRCSKNECFPIRIINDDLIEDTESFTVTLARSAGQTRYLTISEDAKTKQVNILDNDMAVVGFTSNIYSARENSGYVSVCAQIFTPDIRCPIDVVLNLTLIIDERDAFFPDDFDAPYISYLVFEPCRKTACSTSDILIIEDTKVELTETISLGLQTSQSDLIRLDPQSALIEISDSADRAYVKFEKSLYEVTEGVDSSVEVCAIITSPEISCPVDFIFEIILNEGLNELPIVFSRCSNRSCTPVTIQDDDMIEGMTTIIMRLGRSTDLDSRIIVRTDTSTIRITDDPNERAVVGLERTNYVFPEDTVNPEVCVVVQSSIQCPINIEFSVMIETTDLTAESSDDYSSVRTTLRFNECDTRKCQRINFINDLTTENTERFRVTISETTNFDSRIILVPDEAHVTITDADMAVVNMARSTYTVREDVGMFEICMTVASSTGRYTSCPVGFDFSVILLTLDDSAVRGSDFVYFSKSVTVPACERQACTEVVIIDDCELEDTEQFRVTLLQNGLDQDISIGDDLTTTITITDDDEVNVGMEFTQYTASEDGGTIQLCAVVSCLVPFDFKIYLTTSGGTASADDDYTPLTREELRFAAIQGRVCVNVTPFDDAEVEGDETFVVSLSHDSDLDRRINLNPDRATVIIEDDDAVNVRLEYPTYLTDEDGPLSVQVCAIMISPVVTNCPVDSTVRVRMSTSDGTAVSAHDYTSVSTTLTFAPCDVKSSCVNVYIRDDNIMEASREAFSISLDRGTDSRIRVNTLSSTVSITDNDGVEIGLQRTSHTVAERPGAIVSVCTTVVGSNRVGIPVSLRLSTVRDTAVSPGDYTALMSTAVTFQPGDTSQCVTISINDDDTVEDTESFDVTLTKPNGLDPRVTLRDTSATITITDSDVTTLGFEMGSRTVNESAGTIQDAMCLFINGGVSCSVFSGIIVTFTVSGTANEEEDYEAIPATKELGCGATMCVPITIVDDDMVENEENLIISLSTNSRRITVDPNSRSLEIIINDNDDAMVRLKSSHFLAQESRGREEVCVILLDQKSVAFPFEVHFIFTEGTALTPEDYTVNRETVTFAPGDMEACVEVTLKDSPNLEMPQSFHVEIKLDDDVDNRITLASGATKGEIEIDDDDTATVGLESTSYTYDTGDDEVGVCVYISLPRPPTPTPTKRDCPITFPFDLVFRLSHVAAAIFEVEERQDQPDGGIRKSTESVRDVILEFNSCQRRFCFDVKVKDGATPTPQTDPNEYMIRIARTPDHGRTTLLDDDKKIGRIVVS